MQVPLYLHLASFLGLTLWVSFYRLSMLTRLVSGGEDLTGSAEFRIARNFLIYLLLTTTTASFADIFITNLGKIGKWTWAEVLNIAFLILLLFLSKWVSFLFDRRSKDIVAIREPSDYSLRRQFLVNVVITLYSLFCLKLGVFEKKFYWIFLIFPASVIIHEIWERYFPLRVLFLSMVDKIENENIKIMISNSNGNRLKFWLREVIGNIGKTTINCWVSFAIIIFTIWQYEYGSIRYENIPLSMDITTAFYIAASEMFFNSSGTFPYTQWAKACYFFMHIVGVFLYGVFFVIGVQAFLYASDRGKSVGRRHDEVDGS